MAAQQFAYPARAEAHPRELLEVGGQPCPRPMGKSKAHVPRFLLHNLHQQLEVGGCDTRWASRPRRIRQSLEALLAPSISAPVDASGTDSQRLGNAVSALALGAQQKDGGSQRHAFLTLAQRCAQAASVLRTQLDALGLQFHQGSSSRAPLRLPPDRTYFHWLSPPGPSESRPWCLPCIDPRLTNADDNNASAGEG